MDPHSWFKRERVRSLGFIGITLLLAYLCYLVALPFLPALAWAAALAVIVYPVHSWLSRRVHNETGAALTTVLLVTVILVVPALFVAREVADEATTSIEDVQREVAKGRWRKAIERNPQLAPVLRWVEREVDINDEISNASKQLLKGAGKLVSGSIYAAIGLLVTLYLLFYFLRDRRKVLRVTRAIVPLSDRDADSIFSDIEDAIRAIVGGILIVAAV
jgi:predicted PurR-regulated permease PerM